MSQLCNGARKLPSAHISIRVPWHDNGWSGTVCNKPRENAACLALPRIHENKDETEEEELAGEHFASLEKNQFPPCMTERAGFMSPHPYRYYINHPYHWNDTHSHIQETPLDVPGYAAACMPFAWLLREKAIDKVEHLDLKYNEDSESKVHRALHPYGKTWVQDRENQRVLTDTFFGAIEPDHSLCFFYAKRTPLLDEPSRAIVGVGMVTGVGKAHEYLGVEKGEFKSLIWERAVSHSIRPGGVNGFLFPYQQILSLAEQDDSIDPSDYLAIAPDEAWDEFSYGSEQVSNDSAIATLLSCIQALDRISEKVEGDWEPQKKWLDEQLNRVWSMRGPYPGLGSALTALGAERGALLAHHIALHYGDVAKWNGDIWDELDSIFSGLIDAPEQVDELLGRDFIAIWSGMKPERKTLLRLLARFNLTVEQCTRFFQPTERQEYGYEVSDADLIANPYRLYELDRHQPDAINLQVIDRGLFPQTAIAKVSPVPEETAPAGPLDTRRVRALVTLELEKGSDGGNTLLPADYVIQRIRGREIQPACALGPDSMQVAEDGFSQIIQSVDMADGELAYQLTRLARMGKLIRDKIAKRIKGKRHKGDYDWRKLLDEVLPEAKQDESEQLARQEKSIILEELYAARLSVLLGAAGTGKTTLLKVLCSLPDVRDGGVLLLAPTGKARVQLQDATGIRGAKTIAQFLLPLGRYIFDTGQYVTSKTTPANDSARTVIVDEASMLTEEQFAALLDGVAGVHRLILVGDPRQLPPIGSGRPFIDIIERIAPADIETKFPKVAPGYGELTIYRRQREAQEQRLDIQLAEWFTDKKSVSTTDDLWLRVAQGKDHEHIETAKWQSYNELNELLDQYLAQEVDSITEPGDEAGFEASIGGSEFNGSRYFWAGKNGQPGAGEAASNWQILSPIKGEAHGTEALNRHIQHTYRATARRLAKAPPYGRKTPKPMGTEEIVYGDKVINLRNMRPREKNVFPSTDERYIANGELGIVVGPFRGKGKKTWLNKLEVEFSTQPGLKYSYPDKWFSAEASAVLGLAYALTVHKSQGSEFGVTFIVLPNSCQLLSRELLYTALTRHTGKVVVLHQGPLSDFRNFANDYHSDIKQRLTNLFHAPAQVEVRGRYFEERLIHRTLKGDLVRSKSEVVIANMLHECGIEYQYEKQLKLGDSVRIPDFTIEDADSGEVVYWEHLGMLHDPRYKQAWETKREQYLEAGILPLAEQGGPEGTLVETRDDERGGLDSTHIKDMIDRIFG